MSDSAVPADEGSYRIEHDTMGEVRVPVKALWRAQTQRAVENFPISSSFRGLERTQIRALGLLKGVRYFGGGCTTQSIVMRSKSGTVRMIDAYHRLSKLNEYSAVDFTGDKFAAYPLP